MLVIGSMGIVVGGLGLGKFFVENNNQEPQPTQITVEVPSASPEKENTEPAKEEHTEHVWIPVYETVKHAAVTHTVEHPIEYGTETTYHTVCNTCSEIVDGATSEHQAKTGHSAWSTNVPITNEIITSNAWSEAVTDTPEYEELVQTGEKCSLCGETRTAAESNASQKNNVGKQVTGSQTKEPGRLL